MLRRAREIYRQSKKRNDNFWTEWISRPPAAVVVMALRSTPVTPNQVTFLSVAAFAAGVATLVAWRGFAGLLVAVAITQLSYVLDCADGQLARVKKMASPVGALLDFLMDEIKALLLVAGVSARLYLVTDEPRWLLLGVAGLVAVASGVALTTFMRSAEYRAAVSAPPLAEATDRGGHAPRSLHPVALVEAAGRFTLHYPSWIVYAALLDRMDVFLYAYLAAHFLYLGKASLSVVLKLGRPARAPAPAAAAADSPT